ncbi:putative tail protein [Breoghania corrubedonensis]|uniref:Putative tail protein n=1 Tax=Breoghania corrubedonensis TaxID=665038 RepID=A0A2T5V1N7_9HYPH|nr:glycoside hydrolase/phage tail family protein [Breoghania corrubedonensis]PTW57646.1 putative tail protein [Breoghania corrubedonensis]
MATLVLSTIGQAVGTAIGGPIGGMIGRTAGALAGQAIDQRLFGTKNAVEGARLADLDVQSSTEGTSVPRVYGRARLTGQVIWATRFQEVVKREEEGGGKGGGGGSTTTVTSYSYYGNFAVALCEGPVSHIGRIWADGKLLDTTTITVRRYLGSADQEPDPLIEAKQGLGYAPAYRGTAYLVFEGLALANFGNRLPQIAVEVIRAVDRLEEMVRAVCLIPGAGEFIYADKKVNLVTGVGSSVPANRHIAHAASDWQASLDELQALCPNLERVALVVSWFGDDLRCGECRIRPAVEDRNTRSSGLTWLAGGLSRSAAPEVSRKDGRPAFGGTPADASVMAAIADLKARGLKVMLYPFVLMDVPQDNDLADPYGASEQAAYPWRGRITCHPAPGGTGSVDKTSDAAAQVAGFVGEAAAGDFTATSSTVVYSGPSEWSWRRFILHYAHLAAAAGGVDAFLIGSEMPGMTTVRSDAGYPFVDAQVALAGDVRGVLGGDTAVSYAANWSEYAGHRPADGSGDVTFHLDPLWASSDIDFVGIDFYPPISDWRDGTHADSDEALSPCDLFYLRARLAGGEDYDWYYASEAERTANIRTPITDGAYGKPWVYRAKDLVGWWSNPHHDRPGGVEAASPTAWVPQSKPIWLTELGVPAIDRGANQPNVFYDPKSSESALPYFSNGARDDYQQRRALEACLSWWGSDHPELEPGGNPVSSLYGAAMVDPSAIQLWAWDARPWPAFPSDTGTWADGANWQLGHWLNGRLGGAGVDGLVRAILADFEIDVADTDADGFGGAIDGFVIPGPTSARAVLEQLGEIFGFIAADTGTALAFRSALGRPRALSRGDLAEAEAGATLLSATRAQESELPSEIRLSFTDPTRDFARISVASRRLAGLSRRISDADLNIAADAGLMQVSVEARLRDAWAGRERFAFSLPENGAGTGLALEPGDLVTLEGALIRVSQIEDGAMRRIEGVSAAPDLLRERPPASLSHRSALPSAAAAPAVKFLDLPLLKGDEPVSAFRAAAFARPWLGGMSVWRSASGAGFEAVAGIATPATMGTLSGALFPGPTARWDRVNEIHVTLYGGALSARDERDVLAGANIAAIQCGNGGWEVLQFSHAELTGANSWRLSGLLRAQAGTDAAMAAGAAIGAAFVLIDAALPLVDVGGDRLALPFSWRVVPQGRAIDDETATALDFAVEGAALRPLSPVHLRGRRQASGDVVFTWIRRTRVSGDGWEQLEVPLAEEAEAYELDILDAPGGAVIRTLSLAEPRATYTAADQSADFTVLPDEIHLSLSQLSARTGRGTPQRTTIHV